MQSFLLYYLPAVNTFSTYQICYALPPHGWWFRALNQSYSQVADRWEIFWFLLNPKLFCPCFTQLIFILLCYIFKLSKIPWNTARKLKTGHIIWWEVKGLRSFLWFCGFSFETDTFLKGNKPLLLFSLWYIHWGEVGFVCVCFPLSCIPSNTSIKEKNVFPKGEELAAY